MLVNIWATVTHLSDAVFAGAPVLTKPGLDLLISEGLREATRGRQVWAINPTWLTPGTTGALLRESYTSLRDGTESYLLLVTPGHADLAAGVPPEVVSRQLQELFRRGRAFNKRPITAILGIPPGVSPALAQSAAALNEVYRASVEPFDGIAVDLRGATFDPWGPTGSQPTDLAEIAPLLVDGILGSHCAAAEWTSRYGG